MSDWEKVIEALGEPVRELLKVAWKKITGSKEDPPVETLERLFERALDVLDEIKAQADQLGMALTWIELEAGMRGVLDAFTPKGEFPNLLEGVTIEKLE